MAKFRRFTISRRVTVTSKKAVAVRLLVRDQIPVVEAAAPYNVDCKVRVRERQACGRRPQPMLGLPSVGATILRILPLST